MIDTSAWVEFFLGTDLGEKLRDLLSKNEIYIPFPTLTEVYYILCRLRGRTFAAKTLGKVVKSKGHIGTSISLAVEMGKIKCHRTISLADAGVIALTRLKEGAAVFKKKEREIKQEMEEQPLSIPFIFLEDLE